MRRLRDLMVTSTSLRPSLRRWPRLVAMVVLSITGIAACADDKPLNTFEPRGPQAERIDNLMLPIWPIMGVVFVLVVGATIVLIVKNRVRPEDFVAEDLPDQVHGNTGLELLWTVLPGLLLAVITVPTVRGIWALADENGEGELDVMVIGQQWWWEYRYDIDDDGFFTDANGDGSVDEKDRDLPLEIALDPDDVVTANELVIPAGEQVDLIITSRDVIHSFWIPRLNGKRDAVAGRLHAWSLEAFEPGKYTGWCTEFCGLSHARMRMSTIALPRDEFVAWLENQARPAEVPNGERALAGREIFQNQCVSCHVVTDTNLEYPADFEAALVSKAAPNLTHFATRSVFAGAIFGTYLGPGTDANDDGLNVADYLELSALAMMPEGPDDYRWNSPRLKRWVANAPALKAMAPDEGRGMPAFPRLSDEQLDQLVAYLATLN